MMNQGWARAVADVSSGQVLASVEIAVPPARVFKALTSQEIVRWWVRPGVFDTREWSGDVRVGGRWRASGMAGDRAYAIEGEYLEVDPPRKLVHTWQTVGAPIPPSRVTYLLEAIDGGTRVTLRHEAITPEICEGMRAGWESSFECLREIHDTAAVRPARSAP